MGNGKQGNGKWEWEIRNENMEMGNVKWEMKNGKLGNGK